MVWLSIHRTITVSALAVLAEQAAAGTTKEEAVAALSARYGIRASSAKSLVDAAGALGICEFVGEDEIAATPLGRQWVDGREWVDHASPLNLFRLLHIRFVGVGEVLLQLDEGPRTTAEIHHRQFGGSRALGYSARRHRRTATFSGL